MERYLLSSAYLAPTTYYSLLASADRVCIEQFDSYLKQTYRNRAVIAAANGLQSLTIPVEKGDFQKPTMRDIRISSHSDWQHIHWNALSSAYHSSPFFEYYEADLHPFYEIKFEFLFDYNEALRGTICKLLDIEPSLSYSHSYERDIEGIIDARDSIHPKHPDHIEGARFADPPYYQVFANRYGFQPQLSIVDLLFNMGPESVLVLESIYSSIDQHR